jgi:tryptophan synthase alpha chain
MIGNASRYQRMFQRCSASGEGVFGAFLMLGHPDFIRSAEYLDALVAGGADMVELGIPFSDPVADGPVIQAASTTALASGMTTADCFALIAAFRQRYPDVPVGILTYANIVEAKGRGAFCLELSKAGADSLLIADVPALEAEPYSEAARAAGLDYVMIAAINTPGATQQRIAALSSGYTYCVARPGVTGADEQLSLEHGPLFDGLAQAGAPPPILGFGIATPSHVREALHSGAAGAISGSAIVQLVAKGNDPSQVSQFCAAMKAATRGQWYPHYDPA